MRWLVSVSLVAVVCLAGAAAIAASDFSSDSAPETHCVLELTAGDGSSSGPVTCFDTEAELNEAAGLTNPGLEASSGEPE